MARLGGGAEELRERRRAPRAASGPRAGAARDRPCRRRARRSAARSVARSRGRGTRGRSARCARRAPRRRRIRENGAPRSRDAARRADPRRAGPVILVITGRRERRDRRAARSRPRARGRGRAPRRSRRCARCPAAGRSSRGRRRQRSRASSGRSAPGGSASPDGVSAPREPRVFADDLLEQVARHPDRGVPEREQPACSLLDEDRPTPFLDELDQPVRGVQPELHAGSLSEHTFAVQKRHQEYEWTDSDSKPN